MTAVMGAHPGEAETLGAQERATLVSPVVRRLVDIGRLNKRT